MLKLWVLDKRMREIIGAFQIIGSKLILTWQQLDTKGRHKPLFVERYKSPNPKQIEKSGNK